MIVPDPKKKRFYPKTHKVVSDRYFYVTYKIRKLDKNTFSETRLKMQGYIDSTITAYDAKYSFVIALAQCYDIT